MTKARQPRGNRYLLHSIAACLCAGGIFASAYFVLPALFSVSYEGTPAAVATTPHLPPPKPQVAHVARPTPLQAIYMSQCVSGTPSMRESLVRFIEDTALNAVVIDIRDYTGKISFPTEHPALKDSVSDACGAPDMKQFIQELHEKGIYVIGRITVFQNPYYTKLHPEHAVQKKSGGVWKDFKGLSFVDVSAKPYWDNVVELGKESWALGFDELNFDYIRYPSDGPMSETEYSWSHGLRKPEALEEFYQYLTGELRTVEATEQGQMPVLSADLFGMVATNHDDLNIGQVLERALPYFDYIYPMVYPSHYPKGYNGFGDVNAHPYEIVKLAMDTAIARENATTTTIASSAFTQIASTTLYEKPAYPGKVVPWLQSFDYPVHYTPAMVLAQIKATKDAGEDSWLFWDAANKYTSLRQVLAE